MGGFQTYQTVKAYDEALARHAQYIRWTRSLLCPCVSDATQQPDPQCSICKGRGRIYTTPGNMQILNEVVKHNSLGVLYPKNTPLTGTPIVTRKGVELSVNTVTSNTIILNPPFPKIYEVVLTTYEFTPEKEITNENSTVYGTNLLRTIAPLFTFKGKSFEGSVVSVSRVYNSTKAETYVVTEAVKEYITLTDMGTWEVGDVLEVDYIYIDPFKFLFTGISQRMRYDRSYILDEADALLMTPSHIRFSPDDLFTVLSGEQTANAVLDPGIQGSGNDLIKGYFDVSRLLYAIDLNGVQYTVGTDVELYGRDEIKWNITKPSVRYSIQFTYHPTFSALLNYTSVRNAEDKTFVNRVNLKAFDRMNTVVNF